MPTSDEYDPTGVEIFEITNFKFQNGTVLPKLRLAYRSVNPSSPKKALISTCFLGTINDEMFLATGTLASYHVILVALLGSDEGSAPSNEPEFPSSLDYRDCVRAQYRLVTEKFSMDHLDVVLGFSMGGQVVYHWAAMYPAFVKHAIPICSAARTSLHNRQFLEGPKAALKNSIDYDDGSYKQKGIKPLRGLHAFGRAYSAWLWSPEWFEQEFWRTRFGCKTLEEFTVSGEQNYDAWDPEDILIMAEMWQKADISVFNDDWNGQRSSEALQKALSNIQAKVLVMPSRTDQYFRPAASEEEVKHLKNGELAVIESIWGHPAGGGANDDDTKFIDQKIQKFLAEI